MFQHRPWIDNPIVRDGVKWTMLDYEEVWASHPERIDFHTAGVCDVSICHGGGKTCLDNDP